MHGIPALLMALLFIAIVCGCIYWIWTLLPGNQTVKNIFLIVLIVIFIAVLAHLWPSITQAVVGSFLLTH